MLVLISRIFAWLSASTNTHARVHPEMSVIVHLIRDRPSVLVDNNTITRHIVPAILTVRILPARFLMSLLYFILHFNTSPLIDRLILVHFFLIIFLTCKKIALYLKKNRSFLYIFDAYTWIILSIYVFLPLYVLYKCLYRR